MIPPSDEYLDECFKLFTRFLKEIGQYSLVMKYLFYSGRTKKIFYDDVKNFFKKTDYSYNFGDILHLIPILSSPILDSDWRKRNGVRYYDTIADISNDFMVYWKKHSNEITVPYNKEENNSN